MRKQKAKPSGVAIFMYCVIALCAIVSAVCLYLHYTKAITSSVVFYTGITCFTIMYHLWLRLIMGNVNKLFKIEYTMLWFKESALDKKLCKLFRVKKWKNKALTYNPELFSLKDYSLEDIANTMCKVEVDHLVNVAISLSTLLFSLVWGLFWIFALTALLAILFDMQFVLIQRYNRPRIVKLIERQNKRA